VTKISIIWGSTKGVLLGLFTKVAEVQVLDSNILAMIRMSHPLLS
jgi:hypothetical protein